MNIEEYNYKHKPYKHQLDCLKMSADKKGFAYFMEMGCVSEDTEYLTEKGWKKFKDFDINNPDKIAVPYKKENNKISIGKESFIMKFEYPEYFIRKKTDDFIEMSTPFIKYKVTKDHNMVFYKHGSSKNITDKLKETHADAIKEKTTLALYKGFVYDVNTFGNKQVKSNEKVNKILLDLIVGMFNTTNTLDGDCCIDVTDEITYKKLNKQFLIDLLHANKIMYKEISVKDNNNNLYENKSVKSNYIIFKYKTSLNMEDIIKLSLNSKYYIIQKIFSTIRHFKETTLQYIGVIENKFSIDNINKHSILYDALQFIISSTNNKFNYNIYVNAIYITLFYGVMEADINEDIIDEELYTNITEKHMPIQYLRYTKEYKNAPHRHIKTYIDEEQYCYCFRTGSGYMITRYKRDIMISGNSGKTKTVIDNIGLLYKDNKIDAALIIAPKGVYSNWYNKEFPEHMSDDINYNIHVYDAAKMNNRKYNDFIKQITTCNGDKLSVLCINIDSLTSEKGKKVIYSFLRTYKNVFGVIDESTIIKNREALRSKEAVKLGKFCSYKRILTGSPINNRVTDLFNQFEFLGTNLLGYSNFYSFRSVFAEIKDVYVGSGRSIKQESGIKNEGLLNDILSKVSFRVLKKDCLDLPDKTYITRYIDLTKEQVKAINDLKKEALIILENQDEISVTTILSLLTKTHQILCGAVKTDTGAVVSIKNNRISELISIIEETSGKVVIFANYIANIKDIYNELTKLYGKKSCVLYYGDIDKKDRDNAITSFQDPNSEVRFFIGNTQTAGRGITLTESSTTIYFSNNNSLEDRIQSEDRTHRIGQQNICTYVDIIVPNTLDQKILEALKNKKNISDKVLKDDIVEWFNI